MPKPGSDHLRIRVAAVGVGYFDVFVALRRCKAKPPLPFVPGSEIAGTIDAIGPNPVTWQVGDRISAITINAFAELALAPAPACRRAPDQVEFAASPYCRPVV